MFRYSLGLLNIFHFLVFTICKFCAMYLGLNEHPHLNFPHCRILKGFLLLILLQYIHHLLDEIVMILPPFTHDATIPLYTTLTVRRIYR